MLVSQQRRELLIRILGEEGTKQHIAYLEQKAQLAEKQRASKMKPSSDKLLVEAPQKKTKFYLMRKVNIELFRAIRNRLLLNAMIAIHRGADSKAVYYHPAKEMEWSFCPQYEGKTALQVAVLEQSFEPNDVKKEKLGKIIGFLKKK